MAAAAAAGQAAALPWAAVQLEGGEAPAVDRDLPATLGLQLGARVEVQWSIHVEQEGGGEAETTQWWGAALERRVEGEADGEGRQIYVLRYDPDTDHGFEEQEERFVTFLAEHSLYDLSEDATDLLHWRREGEAWEPPAAGGEGGAEGPAVVSLQAIAGRISQAERLRGRSVDEDTAEALAELPQEQQMFIAAGFRSFADRITAELSKLSEQHGPDYVVTEADMKAATAAAMQAALGGM